MQHDIKQILSSPILISTGVASSAQMTTYWYAPLDTNLLKGQPMWANKLTGYGAIKGTWVIRIEVSAPNTVASRLRLVSKPPEYTPGFSASLWNKKGTCSQLPGVEIDVSSQTSASLRVPMRYHREFASLQYNENAWGATALFQYSPFLAISGTVNYSIWLSFEDAELAQPLPLTLATVTAQSDNSGPIPAEGSQFPTAAPTPQATPDKSVTITAPDNQMYVNPDLLAIVVGCSSALKIARDALMSFQAQGPSTGAQEISKVPTGNLSSMLGAASSVATSLGNMVPSISSYTGAASWVGRVASRLASSYGYSKPRDHRLRTTTIDRFMGYENNSEGVDNAISLGAFSDNCVSTLSNPCGATMDEMSFDFLLKIPCCINTITFSTQAVGSVVYACQLCPKAMFTQSTKQNISTEKLLNTLYSGTTPPQAIVAGPLCALAHSFSLWRGGFRFVLKFAKTKMHKGRLLLTYTPIHPKADTSTNTSFMGPQNLTQAMYGQCVCIDLSQDSEFVFDVPYTCTETYLPTSLGFGWFSMWVVEPLGYTSTVSTSISFNVEVSAMPGFELAVPNRPTVLPVAATYSTVYAQSASSNAISIDKMPTMTVDTAAMCIGEKINSIKQLLTRSSYWIKGVTQNQLNPFAISLPNVTGNTTSAGLVDDLNHFGPWFTYQRGGIIYRVFNKDGVTRLTLHAPLVSALAAKGNGIHPAVGSVYEKREIASVYIPQYSCGVARPIGNFAGLMNDFPSEGPVLSIECYDSTGATAFTRPQSSRVASDEFQFLGFACVPLLVLSPNNTELGTMFA